MQRLLKPLFTVPVAVSFLAAVIVIAHFLAPPEYHWTVHTVSHLGAQQYEHAWLMNLGFIGFGLLLGAAVVRHFWSAPHKNYTDLLILLYAAAVLLSGLFQTASFQEGTTFSIQEDRWHSQFAQMAGFAFSLGIFWHLILYAEARKRPVHLLFLILVIALSAGIGWAKAGDTVPGLGLIQRCLYLVSFGWLWYRYP